MSATPKTPIENPVNGEYNNCAKCGLAIQYDAEDSSWCHIGNRAKHCLAIDGNPVTVIPEGQEYPDPGAPDEPVEFESKRLHSGDRVTHRFADWGPGTVLGIGYERATVSWDISDTGVANYPAVVSVDDLQLDAELPDPKLALAKALKYKASRDEMLKQLWGTADAVAEAQVETGRAYSIAHEMTRRYELVRVQLERAVDTRANLADSYRDARRVLGYVATKLNGIDVELAQKIRDYLDKGEPIAELAE